MGLAAVILAGGLSSRMGGGDKPLIELAGKTILAHVVDRLRPQAALMAVNANGDPSRFENYGLPVIADATSGYPGPLGGVQTGMRWAKELQCMTLLTVAADTPLFPLDLAERLAAASAGDTIAVASSAGRLHPTFALWPVSLSADLDAFLAQGNRKVLDMIERLPHVSVEFGKVLLGGVEVDPFMNINTPDDLAEIRRLLEMPDV